MPAPAYTDYPEFAPEVRPAPRIRVVRGRQQRPQGLSNSRIRRAFVMLAAFLLIFAAVSCIRIGLVSAAVAEASQASQATTELNDLRTQGSNLEYDLANAGKSEKIASRAKELGMAAPSSNETLTLPQDTVATDASGNLSLSASLAAGAEG